MAEDSAQGPQFCGQRIGCGVVVKMESQRKTHGESQQAVAGRRRRGAKRFKRGKEFRRCPPNCGAISRPMPKKPPNTEATAKTISGQVITLGDSWAWAGRSDFALPRNTTKKRRNM